MKIDFEKERIKLGKQFEKEEEETERLHEEQVKLLNLKIKAMDQNDRSKNIIP